MKKKIVFGIIAVMMAVSVSACGDKTSDTDSGKESSKVENTQKVEIGSSADVINKVFDTYNEDEKFPIMGGDADNMADGKAGIYNIEDTEGLSYTLHVTEDLIGQVDEVASALHAMNANTFTSGVFHLKDKDNADTFIKELKESVLSTQWMCGFPEKLLIYTVNDEYVVYVLGNGEVVDAFTEKFDTVYGDTKVLVIDEIIE